MPELAVAWVERLIEAVAEIGRWHGAEGADCGQRARFRAAEGVIVAVVVDVLSFEATRQVDVFHEHVAQVGALTLTRVRAAATPAAEIARVVVTIAGILTPTRVVEHRAPPSETSACSRSRCRPTELPVQSVAGPRNTDLIQQPANHFARFVRADG